MKKSKKDAKAMAKWEEIMRREGLPAELPDDERIESESPDASKRGSPAAEKEFVDEIQRHFEFRTDAQFDGHQLLMMEICRRLDLEPCGERVLFVQQIDDLISQAQNTAQDAAGRILDKSPSLKRDTLRGRVARELRKMYAEQIVKDVLEHMAEEAADNALELH